MRNGIIFHKPKTTPESQNRNHFRESDELKTVNTVSKIVGADPLLTVLHRHDLLTVFSVDHSLTGDANCIKYPFRRRAMMVCPSAFG